MALNEQFNNWNRRQRESLDFWMSVEVGRQAAKKYQKLASSGNRRANELAREMIAKKTSKSNFDSALKEFDFRKSHRTVDTEMNL